MPAGDAEREVPETAGSGVDSDGLMVAAGFGVNGGGLMVVAELGVRRGEGLERWRGGGDGTSILLPYLKLAIAIISANKQSHLLTGELEALAWFSDLYHC